MQGVREIAAAEGAAAFFSGLRPTLLGIMPYSALSFAAFETLKCAAVIEPKPETRCISWCRTVATAHASFATVGIKLEIRSCLNLTRISFAESPLQARMDRSLLQRRAAAASADDPMYAEIPVMHRLAAGGISGITAQTTTWRPRSSNPHLKRRAPTFILYWPHSRSLNCSPRTSSVP